MLTSSSENHPVDLMDIPTQGRDVALAVHRVITAREGLNAEWRKSLCIGAGEMVTLGHLWNNGAMPMQSIAEIVGVSAPTMTAIADRLEARGWVARTHDPTARRRVLHNATNESITAFKPCVEPLVQELAGAAQRYSADQVDIILKFLGDVRDVMRELRMPGTDGAGLTPNGA
jgi:DNA-binding MarR family transcriptional regulator